MSIVEKVMRLQLSTLRCIDAARDLLRRVDALDSEVRELLKELEAKDEK